MSLEQGLHSSEICPIVSCPGSTSTIKNCSITLPFLDNKLRITVDQPVDGLASGRYDVMFCNGNCGSGTRILSSELLICLVDL